MKQREYGYSCFNRPPCRETIEAKTMQEATVKANAAGWKIGLDSNGQAHYGCPSCGPGLFNPHSIPEY